VWQNRKVIDYTDVRKVIETPTTLRLIHTYVPMIGGFRLVPIWFKVICRSKNNKELANLCPDVAVTKIDPPSVQVSCEGIPGNLPEFLDAKTCSSHIDVAGEEMVTIVHGVLQANNTTQCSDVEAAKMCAAKAAKVAAKAEKVADKAAKVLSFRFEGYMDNIRERWQLQENHFFVIYVLPQDMIWFDGNRAMIVVTGASTKANQNATIILFVTRRK
jgi:hypothetical protein